MNDRRSPGWAGRFVTIAQSAGAALVVTLALLFTLVIAVVGLFVASGSGKVAIATAAFTALGTIAGGYSGVRVGAHGKEQSDHALEEAQLVVERLAEKSTEDQVRQARQDALSAVEARRSR